MRKRIKSWRRWGEVTCAVYVDLDAACVKRTLAAQAG